MAYSTTNLSTIKPPSRQTTNTNQTARQTSKAKTQMLGNITGNYEAGATSGMATGAKLPTGGMATGSIFDRDWETDL